MNFKIKAKPFETKSWTRLETFQAFKDYDFPYLVVGKKVRLFQSPSYWKKHGIQPYLACIYATTLAANRIQEFRLRMRGKKVIEQEMIHPGYTVPRGEGGFTIKQVPFSENFNEFYGWAKVDRPEFKAVPGESKNADHFLFISCLPWIDFTHVMVPVRKLGKDSIPQVMWGKIRESKEQEFFMKMSVQVHHALIDGVHIARYYDLLEKLFSNPEETFRTDS